MDKETNLRNAIITGLNIMNDDVVRVPASQIETLADFKDILKGLLNGQLVLATPDRVLPADAQLPNKEPVLPEGKQGE